MYVQSLNTFEAKLRKSLRHKITSILWTDVHRDRHTKRQADSSFARAMINRRDVAQDKRN